MLTSELIDYILDFTGNTVSREKILRWINISQNELTSMNNKIFRVDEYLTTIGGQQEYLMPAGSRFVARVYVKEEKFYPSRYNTTSASRTYQRSLLDDGTAIYEIPFTSNESNNPFAQDVKITFPEHFDPGDTTDVFKIERYFWATQLLSESVQVDIPASQQTEALMYSVLAKMEEMEYGQPGQFSQKFEKEKKPEWIRFSNRGIINEETRTKPRSV